MRFFLCKSYVADVTLSAYYVLGIPLGLYLAFDPSIKMGLYGIWIGLTASLIYSAVIGCWLCLRTDWDEEVRRVRASLYREQQRAIKIATEESSP